MDFDDYRLLRLPEVMRVTGLSRSTIDRLTRGGLFPRPRQIAPRAVGWRWGDLRVWLDGRPPANGEDGE